MEKALFLSHTWRLDTLGRDTHKRVKEVAIELEHLGWSTWFDENDMGYDIDGSMANGIENAHIVIVFLTKEYANKLQNCSNSPILRDNCHKEWTLAHGLCKRILPIVFEPNMRSQADWATILLMHLGSKFYLDCSETNAHSTAHAVNHWLRTVAGLFPTSKQVRAPLQHSSLQLNPTSFSLQMVSPLSLNQNSFHVQVARPCRLRRFSQFVRIASFLNAR